MIEAQDQVEGLVRQYARTGCRIELDPVWLRVKPDGFELPVHGWKLHISSRALTFPELVGKALPILIAESCPFKLARSVETLSRLNDGHSFPATVGKAMTVYPDQRRVRDLGLRLAEALRGHQGPRVLSDRRVSEAAPVYYRYGPFASSWEADERGRLTNRLHGPDGEPFDALATLRYRQPGWAADPFGNPFGSPFGSEDSPDAPAVLGGRYRIVAGLREAATGNVYRAIDERDGSAVVVKQARALVAESGDGNDTRLRLRNERRVLAALSGIAGTPRYVDHFRHGNDEFLVTGDCGAESLAADVPLHGRYGTGGRRSLGRLARQLARILTAVHERGVIVRDLTPKNIVVGDGTVSLIDFGIAAYQDVCLPGRTAGYAPARQFRGEPPLDTDDIYALGMTLLFAATGLDPVPSDDEPDLPRVRALQAIRFSYGPVPPGAVAAIPDLLSGDAACARAALARLTPDGGYRRRAGSWPLPAVPSVGRDQAAEVTSSLLADVMGEARRILSGSLAARPGHDACLYSGTAGIGRELVRHADGGDAIAAELAAFLPELAVFTARTAKRVGLPPGLFTGSTGVAVFLQEACDHGSGADGISLGGIGVVPPGWVPAGDDLIAGAAGVGLGSLLLYRAGHDPAHLDTARRCTEAILAEAVPAVGPAAGPAVGEPSRADDASTGLAHGLAGTTEFLLTYAEQTGDALVLDAAADRVRRLAGTVPALVRQAQRPSAPPLTVSWCRGLAGIGQTLLHASQVLDDPSLESGAARAAEACITRLPRLPILGQCCGAAGVGTFLLDMAAATRNERYKAAAGAAAAHILLRSAGPSSHPVFPAIGPESARASWAAGLTGLLSFFRRLAQEL